jgi:hypothetical protein
MRQEFVTGLVWAGVYLAAISAAAQPVVSPVYETLTPGLEYARIQMTNWNSGEPLSIHVARLDRSQKDLRLESALALDRVLGTAPVSAIAKSFPRERGEPLVAINTGFCIRTKHPYLGAPRGMVITDGQLVSSPDLIPRNYTFWVTADGGLHFGKFKPAFQAVLPDGTVLPIGLNNQWGSNAVVLFTHLLGKSTRATNNLELILEHPRQLALSWRVGEGQTLRVKALNPLGNSPLTNTVAVLSFGSEAAAQAGRVRMGDSIKLELRTSPKLGQVATACHAIFPVVQAGQPLEQFDAEGVILRRNPRTAIGFNERHFFTVVVDGRQKTLSMGVNARELAELMAALGCMEAVNLDGGGSSTFWLAGETRNSVAGSRERDRSDALVIVKRAADHPPTRLGH